MKPQESIQNHLSKSKCDSPDRLLERITAGVFYDVVGAGWIVREDYGKRFEEYCIRLLSQSLGNLQWESEFKYRKKPNDFDTPDILCKSNSKISAVIECKATRMSQQAMFGLNAKKARGYDDLTKAIFQLWRFFSHCRLGYVVRELDAGAVGVVLTLDNWLVMNETLRKQVMADAEQMASERDAEIIEADRRQIVFVAVPELELMLSDTTEETFLETLRRANSEKYVGWRLDGVHKDLFEGTDHPKRLYVFADELGDLLPWWDNLAEERAKRSK